MTETPEMTKQDACNEISLMDFVIALARRKKFLLFFPLILASVVAAITFALPNEYRANTRLLPPQQSQSGASALLAQLGGVAGMAAGVAGLKSPSDLYVGILKSRTIADELIARFDLKKAYGIESTEKARRILEENTVVSAGKDGLITIEVADENQKLVAPLANAYVEQLMKLTRVLAVTEASQRRVFYEQQLEQAKNNLADVESRLKGTLDTRGVVSVDAESRAIVETVGRLRAQVSAKEIQLGAMQAFMTTSHPEYRQVQEELNSLREELARLQNGRSANNGKTAEPTPQVGLQNIKLLRDVKYYQMLYELLAKQYEVARLDEAKDPSIIQVLDKAVEPEKKFKPKRTIIVALSFVAALVLAFAWIIACELKRRAVQSPQGAAQFAELKKYLWDSKEAGI
ncbi:GumC family protein [Massilia sp. LjRoot122]|uniref:GumC family protein n=1 Tax=Massilia sp. LjRoot122 TaxID=3342257 RepID=UPI003ECC7CB1